LIESNPGCARGGDAVTASADYGQPQLQTRAAVLHVQTEPQAQAAFVTDVFRVAGWVWHPHEQAAPGQSWQLHEGVVRSFINGSVGEKN
jgi:hypothetical protein